MQKKSKPKQRVFNLTEAAAYMGSSGATVLKLLECGKIPFQKVGERYFIHQKGIDSWLMNGSSMKQESSADFDDEEDDE